jgi:hypothetical protein
MDAHDLLTSGAMRASMRDRSTGSDEFEELREAALEDVHRQGAQRHHEGGVT